MLYDGFSFKEISKDQIITYHRSRYANGIVAIRGGKAATVQIVTLNGKGYSDVFQENGDVLNYPKSNKASDNKIIDKLYATAPIHVYIYGKDNKRYWSCGIYNKMETFSWGWKLKRVEKRTSSSKRFKHPSFSPY